METGSVAKGLQVADWYEVGKGKHGVSACAMMWLRMLMLMMMLVGGACAWTAAGVYVDGMLAGVYTIDNVRDVNHLILRGCG